MVAAIVALTAAVCGGAVAQSPPARAIDTAHSTATFSVAHVWVEHVTGTIPIRSGSVTLSPGSAMPAAVTAVLDAAKVATDEPDRDAALRSPDFFDVATFPTWTFTSTKVTPRGTNAADVDGDLTIHGVTQPERLVVSITGTPDRPHYHATGTIDRQAFGMTKTRLDPVIGNAVGIQLDIVLQ